MLRFCNKCHSYLIDHIDKNKAYKKCTICDILYINKSGVISHTNYEETIDISNFILGMVYDKNTYPRIEKKIKNHNCGNHILKYTLNKKTMKNIYVCSNCKKYWV